MAGKEYSWLPNLPPEVTLELPQQPKTQHEIDGDAFKKEDKFKEAVEKYVEALAEKTDDYALARLRRSRAGATPRSRGAASSTRVERQPKAFVINV